MKCDMHVHTEFSCDSNADMKKYIEVAKKKSIDTVCFTDHVDYNKIDDGYGYYNAKAYFNKLNSLQTVSDINILSGLEFSEPHLYQDELLELARYPYDYIIGSVHWVGDMFPCLEVREKVSAKDFYTLYWNEVLNAVMKGGFDCLGHIDFPKRYYKELIYDEDKMIKIFHTMHANNIVLEINTSSLRKGLNTTMPDADVLLLYKQTGGEYVTIGSDAHIEEELGEGINHAKQLIQCLGLKQVIFRKRKIELA